MTTETEAQPGSGGAALAAAEEVSKTPSPKNDAEAEQQEKAKAESAKLEVDDKAKAEQQEQERKRNRTKDYIERLQGDNGTLRGENAELRKRLEAIEARLPKQEAKAPNPDDFYNDPVGYAQSVAVQAAAKAREQWEQEQQQQAKLQSEQQVWSTYTQRVQAYTADKPDFFEVVGSIRIPLSAEVQAAIAAHESGPQIAYYLGLNDQDAFQLASVPAQLVPFAVEQIASRLKAAPDSAIAPPPSPTAALAETPNKPISQAPAPAPRVGGRSPTEIPPEKMTDDEWYRQDTERRRKR